MKTAEAAVSPPWTKSEFRKAAELLLRMLSTHAEAGPRLKSLGLTSRFVFTDIGLVLDVSPGNGRRGRGGHLAWSWGKKQRARRPSVVIELTSVTANRCAQAKVPVPLALARGEITVAAREQPYDRDAALDTLPVVVPLQKLWIELLRERGLERLLV